MLDNIKVIYLTLNWSVVGIDVIQNRNVPRAEGVRLWKSTLEEQTRNDVLRRRFCDVCKVHSSDKQLESETGKQYKKLRSFGSERVQSMPAQM